MPLTAAGILAPEAKAAYQKLDYSYKIVLSRAMYAYGEEVGEFARAAVGIEKTESGVRVYRLDGKEYDNPLIAQKLAEAAAANAQYELKAIGCELVPASEDESFGDTGEEVESVAPQDDEQNVAVEDDEQSGAILEGGGAGEELPQNEAHAEPKKYKTSKKK